jgi:hypothetical protein
VSSWFIYQAFFIGNSLIPEQLAQSSRTDNYMTRSLVFDLDHVQIAAPKSCEAAAESFLDAFSALRKSKSLRICVRAADAGSNWDRANYILASRKSFILHEKRIPRLRCARSTCS